MHSIYLLLLFIVSLLVNANNNSSSRKLITPPEQWGLNVPNLTYLSVPQNVGSEFVTPLKIAYIFPMFYNNDNTDINHQEGMLMFYAYYYMLDKIASHKNITYGFNFKYGVGYSYGSPNSSDSLIRKSIAFDANRRGFATVGSATNFYSALHSSGMTLSGGRTFSYSASSSVFDEEYCDDIYMLKAPPSDYYRMKALLALFNEFQWDFAAVITSVQINGKAEYSHFSRMIKSERTVCFLHKSFGAKSRLYNTTLVRFSTIKEIKVLVLFTVHRDTREVLSQLRKLKLTKRFKLVFVYGSGNYVEVTNGYEDILENSLTLDYNLPEDLDFKKFVLSRTLANMNDHNYTVVSFESLYQCNIARIPILTKHRLDLQRTKYKKSCNERELRYRENFGYYRYTPVQHVFQALIGAYHFLLHFISEECDNNNPCKIPFISVTEDYMKKIKKSMERFCKNPSNFGMQLYPYVYDSVKIIGKSLNPNRVSYNIHKFLRNGTKYENKKIGDWTLDFLSASKTIKDRFKEGKSTLRFFKVYENFTEDKADGICRKECPLGYYKVRPIMAVKVECCWDCKPCEMNQVVIENTCTSCSITEYVDIDANKCRELPLQRATDNAVGMYVILVLALSGMVIICYLVFIFVKNSESKIIRASGRELCHSIFFACSILFLYPFIFRWKPTMALCAVRDLLPTLAFSGCCQAVFLKTLRIYRIFIRSKHKISPPLTSPSSQLALLVIFQLAVALAYSIYWIRKEPKPELIRSEDKTFITIHCSEDSDLIKYVFLFGLPMGMVLLNSFMALLTRNCPKNFNESRRICLLLMFFILFTVISICLGSSANPDIYYYELRMSIFCILVGYFTLFCLFFPIAWQITRGRSSDGRHDSLSSASRSRSCSAQSSKRNNSASETMFTD